MKVTEFKNYGTPEKPFIRPDVEDVIMFFGKFIQDAKITDPLYNLFSGRLGRVLFRQVYSFLLFSVTQRVIRDYHAGTISPELQKLIEMKQPKWNPEQRIIGTGWRLHINKMIQEGKADFSRFKSPKDKQENWLLRYYIAPYILSEFIPDDINTTEKELPEQRSLVEQELRGCIAAALDDTEPDKFRRRPLNELDIKKYVEALNYFYSKMEDTEAELHFFEHDIVSFYMNPETGEVIDLRPYQEEISSLLAPVSWEYIKDYAKVIEDYLAERHKKEVQLLGPAEFIAIKNTPESTAISTLTTGYGEIYVQGNLYPDDTTDYTTEIFSSTGKKRKIEIKINAPVGSKGPRPSTIKLKILLEMLFTQRNKPSFSFSIDEYMRITLPPGKEITPPMRKKFKKKLLEDLNLLHDMKLTLSCNGQAGGRGRILTDYLQGPGNTIEIMMDLVYCSHLKQGGLAYYPRGIFQIDEKFVHAIHFLEKLAQNRTSANNVRKGGTRKNTISIKALIETDYGFLPMEKVAKTRKYREAYIDPTVNTIVYLNEAGFISSRFVNAEHEEYTANDLSQVSYLDFIDSKKWLLEYDLLDYKDNPKVLKNLPKPKARKRASKKKTN